MNISFLDTLIDFLNTDRLSFGSISFSSIIIFVLWSTISSDSDRCGSTKVAPIILLLSKLVLLKYRFIKMSMESSVCG